MSRPKNTTPEPEVLDPQSLGTLSAAIAPAAMAPERVADLRERVMAGVAGTTQVLRAADGEWKQLLPGVKIKTLHVDREHGTQTSLWRLAAGARIPPHPHTKDEECLVLEGSITHEGIVYGQGDFLFTRPGLRHRDFIAPEGALLMIRSERIPNALLLRLASHLS
ncbi:MAG TPA: cupin domain-containing protein [Steroidobacteraceae bacterium]|nr:cupin domain-containing protein [Steroidobacteraceae bacterium]